MIFGNKTAGEAPNEVRGELIKRTIPSTGEEIPVIGLGTYNSFDCRLSSDKRRDLTQVLELFIEAGGTVIDSSPMYGQAEAVVGELLKDLNAREKLWLTSKVWTRGARSGIDEMDESYRLMNAGSFMELMQIHNLVDWKIHYKTLRQWKETGKIRYIGISHYSSSSFDEMIQILQAYPDIDFVQYIHSMRNHVAENRLLPFCRDHGVATMANRPIEQGSLLRRRKNSDLPPWAADYSIGSWSQFFLKFLISHPDVTCVIPATSNPAHMADNLNAGRGELPDEKIRQEMIAWIGR
jgi:diketogulonate reductase-like aldo/keto reductase